MTPVCVITSGKFCWLELQVLARSYFILTLDYLFLLLFAFQLKIANVPWKSSYKIWSNCYLVKVFQFSYSWEQNWFMKWPSKQLPRRRGFFCFFFFWKHIQYYAPALIDTGFFVPNCILLKIHASTSLVKRDFMWTSQQTRIYCHYQSCYFNLPSLCSWTCSNYLLAKCHIHKELVSRKSSVKTSKEFSSFQVYRSGLKICWRVVVVQALETPYLFNLLVHSYQTLPSLNWSEKHCNLT